MQGHARTRLELQTAHPIRNQSSFLRENWRKLAGCAASHMIVDEPMS